MITKLKFIVKAITHYGMARLLFRGKYEFLLRSKLLKRKFPAYQWQQRPLRYWLKKTIPCDFQDYKKYKLSDKKTKFFFTTSEIFNLPFPDAQRTIINADEILTGRLKYFSGLQTCFKGLPDWFRNPFTSEKCRSDLHWTMIRDFDDDQGDIKFIWEPSRFAWVYPLVRAYAVSGDEKYVEHFWIWFEDWLERNQPNMGPNYKCGQECAIRCLAVCFAVFAFMNSTASTPQRIAKAAKMLACHAERIEKNISYALYQNNNHAASEANGLYTIGLLFSEFKDAERWRNIGKKLLEELAMKQIFEDGSYIQHSMNYQRLLSHTYLWAVRLAKINSDDFSSDLLFRLSKNLEFLYQMQDDVSGRLPNYGANDGALILPLNNCDYLDYRPVIGATNYLLRGKRIYINGPWDEDILWLFGADAIKSPVEARQKCSSKFPIGGYYTLRNKESWAMVRCHSYETRPGHSDMLAVDLWYKGVNILRDSGTYMYKAPLKWKDYFHSSFAHCTVTIDDADQMTKGLRFMKFDWIKAKMIRYDSFDSGYAQIFEGEHYGYCRNDIRAVHRRSTLALAGRFWLFVDDILGDGNHDIKICWQLADVEYRVSKNSVILNIADEQAELLSLNPAAQCQCLRGDNEVIAGWQSFYYGDRQTAPVAVFSAKTQLPIRFVTLLVLGQALDNPVVYNRDNISWTKPQSQEHYKVELNPIYQAECGTFASLQESSRNIVFSG